MQSIYLYPAKGRLKALLAGIVPVNTIREAKTRLKPRLGCGLRERFVLEMLGNVLAALAKSDLDRTYLVSSDRRLLREGMNLGAIPVDEGARLGPDKAVRIASEEAIRDGANATLVVFSDIPLVTGEDLAALVQMGRGAGRCVIAVCSRRGGTNALWRDPPEVIRSCYGENSFISHRAEAGKAGVPFYEFRSDRISLDIDTPEDMDLLRTRGGSRKYPYLFESTETG